MPRPQRSSRRSHRTGRRAGAAKGKASTAGAAAALSRTEIERAGAHIAPDHTDVTLLSWGSISASEVPAGKRAVPKFLRPKSLG